MNHQNGKSIPTCIRICPHCKSEGREPYAAGFDFEYSTCANEFSFVSCKACGLVYLENIPVRLEEVYPPSYKPFHFNIGAPTLIYRVRNFLEGRKAAVYKDLLPSEARILDVGCGDGRYIDLLKKTGAPGWQVAGIDFSATAVERARSRGHAATLGSYETTPMEAEKYDLIIANQVIEHFADPADVVEKFRHELKPGGLLSLETPSLDGWDAYLFRRTYWGGYHFPRHLTLFSERTLRIFLESRGFKVVSVKYLPSPVFWVFSLHHAWMCTFRYGSSFFSDSNPLALSLATTTDLIQKLFHSKTSNMQVIARKRL